MSDLVVFWLVLLIGGAVAALAVWVANRHTHRWSAWETISVIVLQPRSNVVDQQQRRCLDDRCNLHQRRGL